MGDSNKLLGQLISSARQAAGLSQEEVAARTNLHRTYIRRLERGIKSPTVRVLLVLATVLGRPASEILKQLEEET